VVVLVAAVVVAVQQLTVLVVLVGLMKQMCLYSTPTLMLRILVAVLMVVLPTVVLVRLVHHLVSVAAAAVHPTQLQAVLEVQVVLVLAVVVALAQTATMMVVLVVLAVTQKSRFGYSDEIPGTQRARRSDEHCCLGWCHTIHSARCERTVAMRRTCRRVLRLA
jgi:hypothetical protein